MDNPTATSSATSPVVLERAASAARKRFPEAVVRVVRGRVVAFEGNLARIVAVKVKSKSGTV